MSKFGGALKKLQNVQQEDGKVEPENQETRKPENLKSGHELPLIEREKYSTYLDSDLVTALKLYAVRHKMKHHHVVEAALRAYLSNES